MRKKKVAIAGATGFIGRWFIERYKSNMTSLRFQEEKLMGKIMMSIGV